MKRKFAVQPNGDKVIDDPRTKLRYHVTTVGGVKVAWVIDIEDVDHPIRMATVPMQRGLSDEEVEKQVRSYADGVAKRLAKTVRKVE